MLMKTFVMLRVISLAAVIFGGIVIDSVANEQPIEIPTLQWGDSKRPDGTTRHWNPEPLIDLKATLVCVAYRPLTEKGERWHSVGMTPPKLLSKALENTQPELEECHQHGIKVVGYADTIMFHPDMLEAEGIAYKELYAINRKGEPVINTMWDKSGAGVSCVMNPKWVELQEQVALTTARAGFDGLQFDVYPYAIEPGYLCCCPHCKEAWAKYSRRIFVRSQPMPGLDSGKLDFRKEVDRVFKTWKLQRFADFVKQVEARVRRSYPNFIIIMNHGAGTPDYTSEAVAGALRYPSSELWHLKLGDDSSLYLYNSTEAACGGQAIGLINFAEQYQPSYRYRVALAEAFGSGGTFYFVSQRRKEGEAGAISHAYSDFLREHQEWFNGTKPDASVAILYSWRDQAFAQGNPVAEAKVEFDPKRNHYQRTAAVLARMGVSHDCVILEKGITWRQLSRYHVVVVPDLKLVTRSDAAALEKFVRHGGRLLVIGQFGTTLEVGARWTALEESLLHTWLGKEPQSGTTFPLGKGWVAFASRITTEELVGAPAPPVNPDDAIAQIKAPGPLAIPLKALAPEFSAAAERVTLSGQLKIESASQVESIVRRKGQRRAIHLIRFGNPEPLKDRAATVDYALPKGMTTAKVSVWSPDISEAELGVAWKVNGDHLQVRINRLDNYALVGVELTPK